MKEIHKDVPVYTDISAGNMSKELKKLRNLRNNYLLMLGDFFHHKSTEDLARVYLKPEYRDFVEDYVSICCYPEFKKDYEKTKRYLLKSQALSQTSPKCTLKPRQLILGIEENLYRED